MVLYYFVIKTYYFVLVAVSIITAGNEAQEQIDTKKNVAYEVPTSMIKMTECEAYITWPNRP